MTLLKLYEKVSLIVPIEQRRFFNLLEDSVNELLSTYNKYVTMDDCEFAYPTKLTDDCVILPLYYDAIADNILFYAGKGDTYKSEFVRKARLAYLHYWNDDAKNRRIRRMRW